MNRFTKKALALVLTGVMTLGMASTVLADPVSTTQDPNSSYTNSGDTVASDTATINLIKDYQLGDDVGTGAANTSTFNFKITPYGVWNAGSDASGNAYSLDNSNIPMPYFGTEGTVTASIEATAGATTKPAATVTLPAYNSVGDFWYLVQETATNVTAGDTTSLKTNAEGLKNTGVVYGTNDEKEETTASVNMAHIGSYYMHVQVVNNPNPTGENDKYYRSVTLHKTAPGKNVTNKVYDQWATQDNDGKNYTHDDTVKVNDIQNKYYAGSLSIKKEVAGNAADKDKFFEVTVVFTKQAGTIINSTISYKAVVSDSAPAYSAEQTAQTIVGQDSANSNWKNSENGVVKSDTSNTAVLTNTVKFWIKADQTVTFDNIPYGVTYTVTESDPNGEDDADNSYENKILFTSSKEDAATWSAISCGADNDTATSDFSKEFNRSATGSITDKEDKITITNKKEVSIDIGVILSNAPYIAMLMIIAGTLVLFIFRRKRTTEV